MARLTTFRVWYRNGSARLVSAVDESAARAEAKELAELSATDIKLAYQDAKAKGHEDRAKELGKEYVGLTVVTKVERLM